MPASWSSCGGGPARPARSPGSRWGATRRNTAPPAPPGAHVALVAQAIPVRVSWSSSSLSPSSIGAARGHEIEPRSRAPDVDPPRRQSFGVRAGLPMTFGSAARLFLVVLLALVPGCCRRDVSPARAVSASPLAGRTRTVAFECSDTSPKAEEHPMTCAVGYEGGHFWGTHTGLVGGFRPPRPPRDGLEDDA